MRVYLIYVKCLRHQFIYSRKEHQLCLLKHNKALAASTTNKTCFFCWPVKCGHLCLYVDIPHGNSLTHQQGGNAPVWTLWSEACKLIIWTPNFLYPSASPPPFHGVSSTCWPARVEGSNRCSHIWQHSTQVVKHWCTRRMDDQQWSHSGWIVAGVQLVLRPKAKFWNNLWDGNSFKSLKKEII